jgi:MurNAc alpha-1-phosphate uridylyltransferase
MRAIILAAGRGERLRPLTDHRPKPLIEVRGKPLIVWHIEALARAGVRDIVINTAWLEEQFPAALGDGSAYGVRLHYSFEGRDCGGALETAGGIAKALPLLTADGDAHFWVVSGDVFMPGFEFDMGAAQRFAQGPLLAQLWMIDNPPHHPGGDFGIAADGLALLDAPQRYTWACIGLYKGEFFAGVPAGQRAALRPYLEAAIAQRRLGALHYAGAWTDVGTAERLAALNAAAPLTPRA